MSSSLPEGTFLTHVLSQVLLKIGLSHLLLAALSPGSLPVVLACLDVGQGGTCGGDTPFHSPILQTVPRSSVYTRTWPSSLMS